MNFDLHKAANDEEFVHKSVELLEEKIIEAIEARGQCIFGLSGGSTPKPVYSELGMSTNIDWSKVYLFLVDDRFIEPNHDDSNQKLVRETLLVNAGIPEENILFPDTTLELDACVGGYIQGLIQLFQMNPPDVLTLGLGPDGHIASLFPPVEESAFGEQLALHTTTDAFAVHDRISISPLIIMAAQSSVLLLRGEEKIQVFNECIEAEELDPTRWPLHVALSTERLSVVQQD